MCEQNETDMGFQALARPEASGLFAIFESDSGTLVLSCDAERGGLVRGLTSAERDDLVILSVVQVDLDAVLLLHPNDVTLVEELNQRDEP